MQKSAMKRILILVIIVMMTIAACGGDDGSDSGSDSPDPTDTSSVLQVQVSSDQAPVFAGPSADADIIMDIFNGDVRRVIGKSDPDRIGLTYYLIDLGSRQGWIAETQVELRGNAELVALVTAQPTPLPAATIARTEPSTATDEPSNDLLIEVTSARAIALAEPDRNAEEITTLFAGETYTPINRTEPNDLGDVFYSIRLGAQLAWILDSQVEITGDADSLAVFTPDLDREAATEPTAIAEAPTATGTPTHVDPTDTPEPTSTRAGLASFTPPPSLTPASTSDDVDAENATVTPIPTSTLVDFSTNTPNSFTSTPLSTPQFDGTAGIQEWTPPPLSIDLPEGWTEGHFLVAVSTVITTNNVGLSAYEGPLADGKFGRIWIIWGFGNIAESPDRLNLWADGLQFLRGFMFLGCNIGIDEQTQFEIDGRDAVGTYYSAVACEDESTDIAGYFAALQVDGGNYAIFTGIEPVERVAEGLPEIEAIINTIDFDMES